MSLQGALEVLEESRRLSPASAVAERLEAQLRWSTHDQSLTPALLNQLYSVAPRAENFPPGASGAGHPSINLTRTAVLVIDTALVAAVIRKHPVACELLVGRYYGASIRLARARVGEVDAWEVAQDAWLRILYGSALNGFEPMQPFLPYLGGVIRNVVYEMWRERNGKRLVYLADPEVLAVVDRVFYAPDPADLVQRLEEDLLLLQLAAGVLNEAELKLLHAIYLQGERQVDIGRRTGQSNGTINNRKFRLLGKLRSAIAKVRDDEGAQEG